MKNYYAEFFVLFFIAILQFKYIRLDKIIICHNKRCVLTYFSH